MEIRSTDSAGTGMTRTFVWTDLRAWGHLQFLKVLALGAGLLLSFYSSVEFIHEIQNNFIGKASYYKLHEVFVNCSSSLCGYLRPNSSFPLLPTCRQALQALHHMVFRAKSG